MSLFDDPGAGEFDAEYRRDALDQFAADLDSLCDGSGRKGQDAGRRGWAFCSWCENDIRTDSDIGFWMAAHLPTFEHDTDEDRIENVFDLVREGREVERDRNG